MKPALTFESRQKLIDHARQARASAYAPYSGYPVGAALLTAQGKVYNGANVENAAYPTGICAERVAVFNAVTAGERDFLAIAVVTANGGSPCGACRQVLAEFGLDTVILVADQEGRIISEATVKDLLPGAFLPRDLAK